MMKRIFRLMLAVMSTLGICGCGNAPAGDGTTAPEPVTWQKEYSKNLTHAAVESFPVATDSMSKETLRQLCLDFMELQLSFFWKTDTNITFQTSNYKKGTPKPLTTDTQFAGMIYHSKGFGNVYRWLEYYDEATGVLALEKFLADNGGFGEGAEVTDVEKDAAGNVTYQKFRSLMTLGSQCTSTACWSLGRICNSASFGNTADINIYNGFIPVGCYTYGYTNGGKEYGPLTIRKFGVKDESNPIKYDTPDVIKDCVRTGGVNAMYECYAQMKPGDIVVDEGHCMMIKSVNLVTGKDGTPLYELCNVVVNEQIEAWHYEGTREGVPFKQQGGVNRTYTFKQLQDDNYLPFTVLELLDENDPQDKKHIDYYNSYADKLEGPKSQYAAFPFAEETHGAGIESAVSYCTYDKEGVTVTDFQNMVVGSNYSMSDVFVTVTDQDGKLLLQNIYRATYSNFREVPMTAQKCTWEKDDAGNYLTVSNGLEVYANGENTVTVTMRVSTGQVLTAYSGTLLGA